jgi:hypothetical protein
MLQNVTLAIIVFVLMIVTFLLEDRSSFYFFAGAYFLQLWHVWLELERDLSYTAQRYFPQPPAAALPPPTPLLPMEQEPKKESTA